VVAASGPAVAEPTPDQVPWPEPRRPLTGR
jgi:hypothetical protein